MRCKVSHLPHEYVREHARLRAATSMPISGGESLFTRYEFVPVFEKRAFDIVQPDAAGVGGITEAAAIAAMAEAHGVRCTPHVACSSGTGVGLACWPPSPTRRTRNTTCTTTARCSGSCCRTRSARSTASSASARDSPGLGVDLDPDAFERYRVDG